MSLPLRHTPMVPTQLNESPIGTRSTSQNLAPLITMASQRATRASICLNYTSDSEETIGGSISSAMASSLSNSSISSIPSFEFEDSRDDIECSGSAIGTSPLMSRSYSSSSSSSEYAMKGMLVQNLDYGSKRPQRCSVSSEEDSVESNQYQLPVEKELSILSSPMEESYSPLGNGKHGMDVWPPEVEDSFFRALSIIPALGRKKILIGKKRCGRNELVADYIFRKTGKLRSRKQVSSHIQVLKNLRKNDEAFLMLVREPLEGTDVWVGDNESIFFDESTSDEPELPTTKDSEEIIKDSLPLLSPYTPSFLSRSYTSGSELPSPAITTPALSNSTSSKRNSLSSPITFPLAVRDSPVTGIESLYLSAPPTQLSFPQPISACNIAPTIFCLWTSNSQTGLADKVLAKLTSIVPAGSMFIEDLPLWKTKYPRITEMYESLPCPFLHVKINLDLPEHDFGGDKFNSMLKITSTTSQPLSVITTIYSFGHRIIQLVDNLPSPTQFLSSNSYTKSTSTTANQGDHCFAYNSPFAVDFWSIFLKGQFKISNGLESNQESIKNFAKIGSESSDFGVAIEGVSVIQEYVFRNEFEMNNAQEFTQGSDLGSVVLVVVYDLECTKHAGVEGAAEVNNLKIKSVDNSYSTRRTGTSKKLDSPGLRNLFDQPIPSPTKRRENYQNHHRPNLSLTIPTSETFKPLPQKNLNLLSVQSGNNIRGGGFLTPWDQGLHTPALPPPLIQPSAEEVAFTRIRLSQGKVSTSNEVNLVDRTLPRSPPLVNNFGAMDSTNEEDYFNSLLGGTSKYAV